MREDMKKLVLENQNLSKTLEEERRNFVAVKQQHQKELDASQTQLKAAHENKRIIEERLRNEFESLKQEYKKKEMEIEELDSKKMEEITVLSKRIADLIGIDSGEGARQVAEDFDAFLEDVLGKFKSEIDELPSMTPTLYSTNNSVMNKILIQDMWSFIEKQIVNKGSVQEKLCENIGHEYEKELKKNGCTIFLPLPKNVCESAIRLSIRILLCPQKIFFITPEMESKFDNDTMENLSSEGSVVKYVVSPGIFIINHMENKKIVFKKAIVRTK